MCVLLFYVLFALKKLLKSAFLRKIKQFAQNTTFYVFTFYAVCTAFLHIVSMLLSPPKINKKRAHSFRCVLPV